MPLQLMSLVDRRSKAQHKSEVEEGKVFYGRCAFRLQSQKT